MKKFIILFITSILSFNNYAQSSTNNEKELANKNSKETLGRFVNDLIIISESTKKWSIKYVQKISYDVEILAEAKYLKSVHIILLNQEDKPIIAKKYVIGLKNKTFNLKGIEKQNWIASETSSLAVVLNYNLSWHRLSLKNKKEFMKKNKFKIDWIPSNINTTYSHLKEDLKFRLFK